MIFSLQRLFSTATGFSADLSDPHQELILNNAMKSGEHVSSALGSTGLFHHPFAPGCYCRHPKCSYLERTILPFGANNRVYSVLLVCWLRPFSLYSETAAFQRNYKEKPTAKPSRCHHFIIQKCLLLCCVKCKRFRQESVFFSKNMQL